MCTCAFNRLFLLLLTTEYFLKSLLDCERWQFIVYHCIIPFLNCTCCQFCLQDSPLARTFTAPLFGATPSWQLRAQHSSQNMLTQQQQYQYQQARQLSNTFSTKSDGSTRSHPSVVDEAVQILREECDGELEC